MSSTINPFANSLRPSTGVNCARYVGRVGALAVSLGVGFAIATNPGVAYADESTDSDPQPNTTTTTNETTTTNTASAAQSNNTAAATRQAKRPERNRILRVFGVNPSNVSRQARNERPRIGRDDQTNDDVNAVVDGNDTTGVDPDIDTDGGAASPATTSRATSSRNSANAVVRQLVSPRRTLLDQPVQRPILRSADSTAGVKIDVDVDKTAASKMTVDPVKSAITSVAVSQPSSVGIARRIATQRPVAAALATPAPPTPVARPTALVSGFLAAVGLTPTLTPPTTPAPAPATFVWAVLAFVRREIEQVQRTYLNRTPDARADIVSTREDTPVIIDPLANDVDPDRGDIKTITSYTEPAHGTLVRNADGTFTYKPNANYNGTDSFSYTISDESSASHVHGLRGVLTGGGHVDTATVNITVTAVNDAPVATGGPVSVDQDSVLTGRLPATDVDGDTLTYSVLGTGAAHGTVVITNSTTGDYTYTPNAGFNGPDAFTFVAKDASATSNAATVNITVNPAADAPTASVSAGQADPDTGAVGITFRYTDSASDRLTTTTPTPQLGQLIPGLGSGASDGTTSTYTTTYTYVPTPEARLAAYNGTGPTSETLTFSVSDGRSTSVRTVNVPISAAQTPVTIAAGDPDASSGVVPITLTYLQNESDPEPAITLPDGKVVLRTSTTTTVGNVRRQVLVYDYTPDPQARIDAYDGTGPTFEELEFTVAGGQPATLKVTAAIEPAAAAVTETVEEVGQTPTDVAVAWDGTGYVTDVDGDTVWVLDGNPDGTGWSVGTGIRVGDRPGDIATDLRYAYVINRGDGTLSMIDLATKQEVVDGDGNWSRIDVGDATDVATVRAGLGYDFDRAYTVDSAGTVLAIDPSTRRVVGSVETATFTFRAQADATAAARSAPTLAVAPSGEKLYVSSGGKITTVKSTRRAVTTQLRSADENALLATSSDDLEVVDALDVDGDVTAMEVSPDGRRLYATVVKDGAAELVTYDTTGARLARVDSLAVGADARRVAVSNDGNRAYVTSAERVSVVDLRERAVVERIDTRGSTGVAIVPGRDTVLVTDPSAGAVKVVRDSFTASTVANADTARTGEDSSVVINVLGNDTDTGNATLTPVMVRGPANGTTTVNADGTITYRPNADFRGTDTFSYTATGGTSNATPTNVSVTVTSAINVGLTWGSAPSDLDAHLLGPAAANGSGPLHVFYSDRTYEITTRGIVEAGAFLDVDDTNGNGPEVIEINTRTPGEYIYYVDNFSNDGGLSASGAKVTVRDPSTGLVQEFSVPSGSGRYWSVFKMTVSAQGTVTLTALDHLSNTEPTLANPTPGINL